MVQCIVSVRFAEKYKGSPKKKERIKQGNTTKNTYKPQEAKKQIESLTGKLRV